MAGTYPTDPEFQAINLESRHSNLVSETVSGRLQVRTLGGQRWSFTAKYNPMTRAEFMPVFAFVMRQQGQRDTFTIVPPVISDASGDISGTMSTSTAVGAGISSIPVDGFTGTIKAGDVVKFAGHSKVYMVTQDQTGTGNIFIEPPLVSAVADNEVVTYDSVPFTMRLSNDIQSYSLAANEYFEYEVDMIEVL